MFQYRPRLYNTPPPVQDKNAFKIRILLLSVLDIVNIDLLRLNKESFNIKKCFNENYSQN